MTKESEAVEELFSERKKFLILGLTGLTGSGCSTTADLLKSKEWSDFNPPSDASFYKNENDVRKYKILYEYLEPNWSPFEIIRIKDIITGYLLNSSFDDLKDYLSNNYGFDKDKLQNFDDKLRSQFDELTNLKNEGDRKFFNIFECNENSVKPHDLEAKDINFSYDWYFDKIPTFSNELKSYFDNKHDDTYTKFYQTIGDNIRSSREALKNDFSANNLFSIALSANKLIKLLREKHRIEDANSPCLIAIDTLRNPFEVFFFKERYSAFYLVGVSTTDEELRDRLGKIFNYTPTDISSIKKKEYDDIPDDYKFFITQNIKKCIEIADIYINNPGTKSSHFSELKQQIVWYIALMKHPGLVTPTNHERTMQLAYTSKLNSGCISRQVGAVVTDKFFSIKAVGWNNTPEGQVPCLLRKANYLMKGQDQESFSSFELNDKEFRNEIQNTLIQNDSVGTLKKLNGRHLSFCFKDAKNCLDSKGNQVHSRSLHAEENAFLQISKYGGQPLMGGYLFTTASPCELCSKKAYQLGIKEIYYIDPYPGIAEKQILESGKNRPKLSLFSGAIGMAYHNLYQPILPYKDELRMLLGYKWPDKKNEEIEKLNEEIEKLKSENENLKKQAILSG